MNSSTFFWLLLAVQLVKSESDVKMKDSSAASKLEDLISEFRAMDPPKKDLFDPQLTHSNGSMRMIHGGPENPYNYETITNSTHRRC